MTPGSTREALFSSLLSFCRACGIGEPTDPCADCGTALAGPRRLTKIGALGATVEYRQKLMGSTERYIVVGGDEATYLGLDPGGEQRELPVRKVKNFHQAIPDQGWTTPGAVLAAAKLEGVSPALRTAIEDAALGLASNVAERRGLCVDAHRLGRPDVARKLPLSPTEATWIAASVAASTDGLTRACEMLLELPSGKYPARLAVWFEAVLQDRLPPSATPEVISHAKALAATSKTAAVAAALLLCALSEDTELASLLAAVRAAQRSGPDAILWSGIDSPDAVAGDTPWHRLAAARVSGREALGRDPSVLDFAPPAVLDDLIDAGAIPDDWCRVLDRPWRAYVAARMRPETLSEEELLELRLDRERARRAFIRGAPCPADVEEGIRNEYALWTAASTKDAATSNLLEVLESVPSSYRSLAAEYLDGEVDVPDEKVLESPAMRALLAGRRPPSVSTPVSDLTPRQREFLGLTAAHDAKQALHEWDWQGAQAAARTGLKFAREEALRDELLNLLACALWQLNRDEEALRALEDAIEGDYTEALQANIAVVAASLQPELAAEHLAKLVVDAPSRDLRLAAARRAIQIWGTTDEPWTQGDQLPDALAMALRNLVMDDLPMEDFRLIARLLADYDREWLASPGQLDGAHHGASPEARVLVARATGFAEFLGALRSVVLADAASPWATEMRDSVVAAALDAVIVDEPDTGAVLFGMAILDEELPMPKDDLAVLRAFVARGVARNIDPDEGEPNDKFLDWLEAAASELDRMPADLRERADLAIRLGFQSLLGAYLQSRWNQFQQAAEFHDDVVENLRRVPRHRINRAAVREAVAPIHAFCQETYQLMMRFRLHTDEEAREYIDELLKAVNALGTSTAQLA